MAQTMTAIAPSTPRSRFGSSIQYGHSRFGSQDDVSMADGLPSIDFGFDDLRERMSAFTARFDDFIARGRKRVLEERNAFRISAVEIADTQRSREQAILDIETRSNVYAETIAKEAQETAELREAITTLQSQKEEQLQRRTDLEAQVRTLQADIKERKEAQAAHHKALDAQARQDIPELRTWENILGLRISAGETGTQSLRFIFDIPSRQGGLSQEAWLEMDFAERQTVTRTSPSLDESDVHALESKLADDRDIGAFLKAIRTLFIAAG